VEKDLEKAKEWASKASKKGSNAAKKSLKTIKEMMASEPGS